MKNVVFLACIATVLAGDAATTAKRINNVMGQKFLSEDEVTKIETCMEPVLYKQLSVEQTKQQAIACALKSLSPTRYGQGFSQYNSFDACVKKGNSNASVLFNKVYDQGYPVYQPLLNQCNSSLTACKAANKGQATCVSQGYDMINTNILVPKKADDICNKLVDMKIVNKIEFDCVKQFAPVLLNVTGYSCAKRTFPGN